VGQANSLSYAAASHACLRDADSVYPQLLCRTGWQPVLRCRIPCLPSRRWHCGRAAGRPFLLHRLHPLTVRQRLKSPLPSLVRPGPNYTTERANAVGGAGGGRPCRTWRPFLVSFVLFVDSDWAAPGVPAFLGVLRALRG